MVVHHQHLQFLQLHLFQQNTAQTAPHLNVNNFFESIPDNSTRGVRNDFFGSQAVSAIRENKTKTQDAVDDYLHEIPENIPELELEDGLVQTLGIEAEDLLDPRALQTKKEEEDEILKNLMDEYDIEDIKNTMDETGQVPESIYFFYGGK